MPNIEDDIRKADKRLKALRKTASAHNKANRIFVYKRDGQNVSEDALKSQMRSKGLSTESRAAQLRNMVRTAENKAAAKLQYGPIASWDTSEITDMSRLFLKNADFNEDISRWDVSSVTSLHGTFQGATSFNQQLGGFWSGIAGYQSPTTSGGGCPGSIA